VLTIDETCAALRLGRNSVYREIEEGRLTLLKRGRRSLIAVEDVRAWPARVAALSRTATAA